MKHIKLVGVTLAVILLHTKIIFGFQQPSPGSLIVNKGHSSPLRKLFFSDDGKKIISQDVNYNIKVWDIDQKTLIREIHNHSSSTNYGHHAFSDGKYYYSDDDNYGSYLYDIVSGRKVRKISNEYATVSDIVKHPFQYQVFVGAYEGIERWDYANGKRTKLTFKGAEEIFDLRINHAGTILASCNYNGREIVFWNTANGQKIKSIQTSEDVISFDFSANDRYLCIVYEESYDVEFIEVNTGKSAFVLANEYLVKYAAFHPKKTMLASCDGKYLKLWDTKTKKPVYKVKDAGNKVIFDKKGEQLATYGVGQINIRNAKTGALIQSIPFMDGKAVVGLEIDANKQLLWVNKYLEDNYLTAWNIDQKTVQRKVDVWQKASGMHPSKVVTINSQADTFHIYNKSNSKKLYSIVNEEGQNSPDHFLVNDQLMLVSFGNKVKAYDLEQGKKLYVRSVKEDISEMILSSDKPYFAIEGADKIFIGDLKTGKLLHKVKIDLPDGLKGFAFRKGSGELMIIYGEIYLWNPLKEKMSRVYKVDNADVDYVRFSYDNTTLMGLAFQYLELVDAKTGKKFPDWRMHKADIYHASFVGNNRYLMTADGTGTIKIWEWKTRKQIANLYVDASKNAWVMITPDNRYDANPEGLKHIRFSYQGKYDKLPNTRFKRVKNLFANIIR
ncbi:hypothetical protein BKI52_38890 [marine bacterium AO1-C]|nr:hypothetical protein BKI52_38890 [marine bacterium AO1-C]